MLTNPPTMPACSPASRERTAHEGTTTTANMNTTLRKMVDHPYFSLGCFVAVCVVLPQHGAMAIMTGCATVLSACVTANPERFRSRSGSLTAAVCLVIAMWVAAAFLAVLSLTGWLVV